MEVVGKVVEIAGSSSRLSASTRKTLREYSESQDTQTPDSAVKVVRTSGIIKQAVNMQV